MKGRIRLFKQPLTINPRGVKTRGAYWFQYAMITSAGAGYVPAGASGFTYWGGGLAGHIVSTVQPRLPVI
jgi:hypothetical protein